MRIFKVKKNVNLEKSTRKFEKKKERKEYRIKESKHGVETRENEQKWGCHMAP